MTLNIPAARGVPGFETVGFRQPQWWDMTAGASPAGDENVDGDGLPNDPRWNQATRHEWSSGTSTEGILRALYQDETGISGSHVLYLSFQVLLDPNISVGTDGVFLGLQSGANPPHVFEFDAYHDPTDPVQTPAVTVWHPIDATDHYDTGWTLGGTQPTWTLTARSFLKVTGTNATWSINVRVPMIAAGDLTNDGIQLGTTFKIFVAMMKDTTPGAAPYMWPRTAPAPYNDTVAYPPFGKQKFPAVSAWDTAQLGTGGAGISINAGDIGTTNVPSNQINYSTAHDTLNTLYADITNTSGASIPAGTLRARFRIANWGSQPWSDYLTGATDWEIVPPANPEITNPHDIANNDATANRRIPNPWTISIADANAWIAAGKTSHQCLLVELSSKPPAQYDFVQDSAFNNMWFVQVASAIQKNVQISLPKVKAGIRGMIPILRNTNVYVFVSTSNMPAATPRETPLPPRTLGTILPFEKPLLGEQLIAAMPQLAEAPPHLAISPKQPITIDYLKKTLTTIQYFVYRDTGRTVRIGGKVRPLLAQQTSFGYFVQHAKPIYGWDNVLGGDFAKVGPNMYKLAMPAGGTKVISTKILGYEAPPPVKRLAPITPLAPAGPIQQKIPIVSQLPAIGSLLKAPVTLLRR